MKTITIIFEKSVNGTIIREEVKPMKRWMNTTINVYEAAGWKVRRIMG